MVVLDWARLRCGLTAGEVIDILEVAFDAHNHPA